MPSDSPREILLKAEDLQRFCAQVFSQLGLPDEDADLVADSLVESDLRGVHSHGVVLMPTYARRLQGGGINPRPDIRVVRETVATALIDGDDGQGQVVAKRAMEIAIAKARETGSGTVGVLCSSHFGAGSRWPMMALAHDMIGLAVTSSGASVAPWGGKTPLLGTNPWAVAIPAGQAWPIVLDMATSVMAGGKLVWAVKCEECIPLGWAVDTEGHPTTDPERGLAGRLLSAGGYKGYGLAVAVEMLASALTGASLGARMMQALADSAQPLNVGHFFVTIDVGAFMPPDQFKARVDDFVREMKQAELEPGVTEMLLPGELEFRMAQEQRRSGIPLPMTVLLELEEIGEILNLSVPWKSEREDLVTK